MIDWDRVAELRDEVGEEDFLEVAELFLEEVDEVIERLTRNPEPARYEEDLHFLKGSALNLGFQTFSELCGAGEKTAADGDVGSINIGAIIESYNASRGQFASHIAKPVAA